jgi:hypothetical protein
VAIYEVGALLEGQAGRLAAVRVHDTTREASRELGGAIKEAQAPAKDGARTAQAR